MCSWRLQPRGFSPTGCPVTARPRCRTVWVRVSTGGQDEANQVPDIERHCVAHGYTIAERYELNDKSASKGQQQAKLDEMLDDMRDGTITVLVCWHSDRLERRGPEYVFRLLAQARDAGGRIESVQEALFGAEDMSGEAMTALGAVISHQYSVHLGEQVKRRPHRGPVNISNRPMLASLKCARCEDSPMYRIRLKSRSGRYYWYYRCAGRGAQRKGCGNMVPYRDTQIIVATQVFMTSTEPHRTRHWVGRELYESEISYVKQG